MMKWSRYGWYGNCLQNLQQENPIPQHRCFLKCRRSALAILTGLLFHSGCKLCIQRKKPLHYWISSRGRYHDFGFVVIFRWWVTNKHANCLRPFDKQVKWLKSKYILWQHEEYNQAKGNSKSKHKLKGLNLYSMLMHVSKLAQHLLKLTSKIKQTDISSEKQDWLVTLGIIWESW